MQEDIERRTVALSVNATKLTGRTLAKVLEAALRQIQKSHQKRQTPQGRQSVKKLMNHGVSTNSLDLSGDTQRPFPMKILTTPWLPRTTKAPFLTVTVRSSTTLTVPCPFKCHLLTTVPGLKIVTA